MAINDNAEFCVQRHIAILKALKSSPVEYIKLVLESTLAFEYSSRIATGIAQKTVPLTGLREMPFPLPPLAEQARIVAKANELMALCDRLQAAVEAAQTTRLELADAVAQQAVAA